MGLVTGIAIVNVSTILDKAEKNHYETQQKNMIMATQSYVQNNRNILPKEIGCSKIVTLKALQNRKYISYVGDCSKLSCSNGTLDEGESYRGGAYCHTYSMTNANCYACGLGSNCCGCSYSYCNSYCTGYNTCYTYCTAYKTCYEWEKIYEKKIINYFSNFVFSYNWLWSKGIKTKL